MMRGAIASFAYSLGMTSIEVYEWSESDVKKKRLSVGPNFYSIAKRLPDLHFSGWGLAHAVIKADYLETRNRVMPGIGFLLQAADLIDFSARPIALTPGAHKALNDVSLTSLAGRVGQGLAILYAHRLGLKFTAHLRSHVEGLPAASLARANAKKPMADFLFSNGIGSVLIESKGSFTLQTNDPTAIKSKLKAALEEQVDPWMGWLTPPPANGYAVYTCLRSGGVPSSMSVVDPEGEDEDLSEVALGPEQVARINYSAWLRAMGLAGASERLLSGMGGAAAQQVKAQAVETQMLVMDHDGRSYAFLGVSITTCVEREYGCLFVGLEMGVLEAISVAIANPSAVITALIDGVLPFDVAYHRNFSVFPDGTVLGVTRLDLARTISIML